MKVFVVRLNPDTREGVPYSNFLSEKEYAAIHNESPMDGFHEAVNFLAENGVVKGYLPPRHSKAMRSGKPFTLITITAKSAAVGGDKIIGVQTNCVYEGESRRLAAGNGKELVWHYRCPSTCSYIFPEPIPKAREKVLGRSGAWYRGPTCELNPRAKTRLYHSIVQGLKAGAPRRTFIKLIEESNRSIRNSGFEDAANFDAKVSEEIKKPLKKVKGNPSPSQYQVSTYKYQRDYRVVAYVLKNAKGRCFDCREEGPFISKTTGFPYLEVHHIHMLKNAGADTPDNAIALCPNCHRKRHYSNET